MTYYTLKHSPKRFFWSLQLQSIEIVLVLEHSTNASICALHSCSAFAFCCFSKVSASRLERMRCCEVGEDMAPVQKV